MMKLLLITFLMLFVAVSAGDFKSGDNGLSKWDSGCFFHANSDDVIGSRGARPEECGGICIANPDCNHFSINDIRRICLMIRSGPRTASDFQGSVCGFIPSRAF